MSQVDDGHWPRLRGASDAYYIKRQGAIPQDTRKRLGLLPGAELTKLLPDSRRTRQGCFLEISERMRDNDFAILH